MCKFKSKGSYHCCLATAIITLFIGVFGAIFTGKIISSLIRKGLKDQVVLKSSNVDSWGNIPGKYGLEVKRKIFFFDWTNSDSYALKDEKPNFKLVEPVTLREMNEISDIKEDTGNDRIRFNLTYNLTELNEGENDDPYKQEITIPNLYAFGVWDTSKNLDVPSKAMTTLGSLYIGLLQDNVTYLATLAVGVDQIFFAGALGHFDNVYAKYFQNAGVDQTKAREIFDDDIMGFGDANTRKYWIQAAVRGLESPDSVHLSQYFNLRNNQLVSIFENLNKGIQAVKIALKNGYQCPGDECDSNFLTLVQLASQNITKYPPSGPSIISIVDTNATAFGYPEISYFFDEVFVKNISPDPIYQKDTNFTLKQMMTLLNMTETGCAKVESTLLHPTNIHVMMQAGFNFEKSGNIQDFSNIVDRFELNNVYQARILFEYLKYLATNFSTVDSQDFELTLRAQFFAQGAIPIWQFAIDNLKSTIVNYLAFQMAKTQKLDCKTSLTLSSPNIDPVQLSVFCMAGFDQTTINRLFDWCGNQTTSNFNNIFGEYKFKKLSVSLLCTQDSDTGSFAYFYDQVHAALSKNYNCQHAEYCTGHELIAKQWINGTITSNPPTEIQDKFPAADSLSKWFPQVIPSPFEFSVIGQGLDKIGVKEANKFLFWENAFAQAVIVKGISEARGGKTDFLKQKLFQTDVKAFEDYMNNFIIDLIFGGMSVKSTVKEFIEGYTSPLMQNIQETNPIIGGDPSVDPTVSLVPKITVLDNTRNTGAGTLKDVDQFTKINDLEYINLISPFFDGNKTTTMIVNPWKIQDKLKGSDNIYPSGLDTKSSPIAYISDLCRYGYTEFKKKVKNEKYGLESYRFAITDKTTQNGYDNPENEKYYMNVYNGAFNLTSVQKTPIFVTKLFMNLLNESIVEKISMVDSQSNPVQFNEDTDDVFLELEPITGIPTRINLDLQTNVEVPFDTLFTKSKETIFPVFMVRRDMDTLSDDQINNIFGDVIKALNFTLYLRIGFIVLATAVLIGTYFIFSNNKGFDEGDDQDGEDDGDNQDLGKDLLTDEEGGKKKGPYESAFTDGFATKLDSAVDGNDL